MRSSSLLLLVLLSGCASAQVMELQEAPEANQPRPVRLAPPPARDHTVYLRCGALWDGKSDQFSQAVLVKVQGDRIAEIIRVLNLVPTPPPGSEQIDLS